MTDNAENTSSQGFGGEKKDVPIVSIDVPKVTGLHLKVIETAQRTINEAKARGFDIGIHSGLRTFEEQNKLYAQGRTMPGQIVTNAMPYDSWHNYGLAVDLVFKSNGVWTWNKPLIDWEQLGIIGKLSGFTEWGGDWQKIKDMPHFQMRGKMTIEQAKILLFKEGVEAVWDLI